MGLTVTSHRVLCVAGYMRQTHLRHSAILIKIDFPVKSTITKVSLRKFYLVAGFIWEEYFGKWKIIALRAKMGKYSALFILNQIELSNILLNRALGCKLKSKKMYKLANIFQRMLQFVLEFLNLFRQKNFFEFSVSFTGCSARKKYSLHWIK